MAKQWTCARCSTKNDEGTLTCSNCRMIRGAVVVPGSFNANSAAPWSGEPQPAAGPPPGEGQPPGNGLPPTGEPGSLPPTGEPGSLAPSYWSPGAAGSPGVPAAAPTPTPLWRRIPVGLVLFVVLLGGGAVASFVTNAGRSDTGEIVNDGDMMATDLRMGDCFDLKDPSAEEISDVTARPCTDPHEFELFWTGLMSEGAYPTETAFDTFFESNCVGAFLAYVGTAYENSKLDIYWLYPLEEGWSDGDRSIQCAAYHPTDNQLTGSLRASRQ